MATQRADTIIPFNTANLIFNEVELDATPPLSGQTLITTSATTASWQNQVVGAPPDATYLVLTPSIELSQERIVNFSGEFSAVDNGAGSTYGVSLTIQGTGVGPLADTSITLNNTSNTAKGRLVQDNGALIRSGVPYYSVRVRSLIEEGSPVPIDGDTLDGVVLVNGDLFLLIDEDPNTRNGIYQSDTPSSTQVVAFDATTQGRYIYVSEGTQGANSTYTIGPDNIAVPTEALTNGINVNHINSLPSTTISAEPTKIYLMDGSFTITTPITITADNVAFEGLGDRGTLLSKSIAGHIFVIQANNISIKNIQFTTASPANEYFIQIDTGSENILIENCIFNERPAILVGSSCENIVIKNCLFIGGSYTTNILQFNPSGGAINQVEITGCVVDASIGQPFIGSTSSANPMNNFVFTGSYIANSIIQDNGNSWNWIINNNIFVDSSGTNPIFIVGQYQKITGNIFDGNNAIATAVSVNGSNVSITQNNFFGFGGPVITIAGGIFRTIVSDNTFDGTARLVDIGASGYNTINGNTMTTSTIALPLVVGGGNTQLSVQKNNFTHTLTNPATLSGYSDIIFINRTLAFGPSLLNSVELNSTSHYLYIEVASDSVGGSPIFVLNYTGNGFTTITFNAVGSYIWLRWEGAYWEAQGSNNVVLA